MNFARNRSVRSSSTAYSSNGLFKRNRHNSVYSSPEAGQLGPPPSSNKMKLYDRITGRKSIRNQRNMMKRGEFSRVERFVEFDLIFVKICVSDSKSSLNGAIGASAPFKNRPRIPTPDVKDGPEKENRFNLSPVTSFGSTSAATTTPSTVFSALDTGMSGVKLSPQQLTTSSVYPGTANDVTLLLHPIHENESGSAHNTLNINSPATAALAKSVLSSDIFTSKFLLTVDRSIYFQLSVVFSSSRTSTQSSGFIATHFT